MSLTAYLSLKVASVMVALPPEVDLALVPVGIFVLGLTVSATGTQETEEAEASVWPVALSGATLVVLTAVYLVLNTVPSTSSLDESAIINGAHELMTDGSLQVTNPLNARYDTNIIGAPDATYRTAAATYHRVFPGTALSYAPFSVLPGDSGYYFYTVLFGCATVLALYLAAWKMIGLWWAAFAAALVFTVSPAFGHWGVTVYNNVPVLGLELGALALILWSRPPKTWQVALAGMLLALAVFMRVTEFIFLPPLLALVWWRCRAWGPCAVFGATALSSVPLVLFTNAAFFDSALFFPHVGSSYIGPQAGSGGGEGQSLFERYFLYVLGVSGSSANFHAAEKLDNLVFHVRYLGSSTFAFPFLAIGFLGIVWSIASGRRNAWLLAAGLGVTTGAVLYLYGHQHDNYFGYGLPIARSSFVRYSLPIYAFVAIGAGAFLRETASALRRWPASAGLAVASLLVVVAFVGIARSYDWEVYGFNRLNYAREHDRAAWQEVDGYLQNEDQPVLLVVGPNSLKLVDGERYPDTINYSILGPGSWNDILFPVMTQALHDRRVYLLVSSIQPESAQALNEVSARYLTNVAVQSGNWALYSVEPAVYEVSP